MRKGCGESWELDDEPLVCGEHIDDVGLCRICETKYDERERILKILSRLEEESCTIESIGVPLIRSKELRELIGDVNVGTDVARSKE